MLSYRHAFHAGNHADVFKHIVLVQVLRYMAQKEKPFWVIDTHAGAGVYELSSRFCAQNREYLTGIDPLLKYAKDKVCPPAVVDYLALIGKLNPAGGLQKYPGSPWLIWQLLRQQDRLYCFERHSKEIEILRLNFKKNNGNVFISGDDGFSSLKALLPPQSRRGLIFIDPSYEMRSDHYDVIRAVTEGIRRFSAGVFIVWYPLLAYPEARRLPIKLQSLATKSAVTWLDVSLWVQKLDRNTGLAGCGLFIINPPWVLEKTLREILPWITDVLKHDNHADFSLLSHIA